MKNFTPDAFNEMLPQVAVPPAPPVTSELWQDTERRRAIQMHSSTATLIGGRAYQINCGDYELVVHDETLNPSGSHDDRHAHKLIGYLMADGLLRPNDYVVDNTTGSNGTALAYWGTAAGLRPHIIVGDEVNIPNNRLWAMVTFGATPHRTAHGGIAETIDTLSTTRNALMRAGWKVLSRPADYPGVLVLGHPDYPERICFTYHADNMIGPQSFAGIGADFAKRKLNAVVMGIGSWVSVVRPAEELRQQPNNQTQIIGFEDVRDAPNYHEMHPDAETLPTSSPHDSYGLSTGNVAPRYRNLDLLDDMYTFDPRDVDPYQYKNTIGQMLGNSSIGTCVVAAAVATHLREERNISRPRIGGLFYDLRNRNKR